MKKLLFTEALAALAVLLILGGVGWVRQASAADAEARSITSTFTVEGMTCGGCEAGVRLKVKKLDGVVTVEASYEEGTAVVTYDPEKVTPEEIIAAIQELGYHAELREDDGESQ